MATYKLTNVVERNLQHPKTFQIPSEDERLFLARGDFVKLGFEEPEGGGERMWVKVTEVDGHKYTGELASHPVYMELHFGDQVAFLPEHVLDLSLFGER